MENDIVYVVQFDTWSYSPDDDKEKKESNVVGVAQSIEDAARLIVAESKKHTNDFCDYGEMWDEYLVTKARVGAPPMKDLDVIQQAEYKDYLEIISCECEFLENGTKTLYMIGKESPAYYLYLEVAKEMGYDIK